MPALKRPLVLVLSAALLVLGFDLATYAATGDSLIVGKSNVANKATKLKRTTGGPVLQLKGKKNSPPLTVNSKVRVDNLNADLVDGMTSAELATNTVTVNLGLAVANNDPIWDVSLPDGTYLVNWQAFLDLVTDDDVLCGFTVGNDFAAMGSVAQSVTVSYLDFLSGSGVVTFSSATTEQFFCNSSVGDIEAFAGNEGIELVFQKVAANQALNVPANP
jgi:hypothetical protein